VLLGLAAEQHPQASALLQLANFIGQHTGARVGFLGAAANSVGAQLVGAQPQAGGLNAGQMLGQPMKALMLFNVEPELDAADGAAAKAALAGSGLVVAFTSFRDARVENADVLLPISPFTETAGAFINAEARLQAFQGVVKARGQTRPGWKVLRVLGNLLGLEGFEHETVEEVRAQALGDLSTLASRLSNTAQGLPAMTAASAAGLQRLSPVPIYATDALVRRAPSLQATSDSKPPVAALPSDLWASLGLNAGDRVRVTQGGVSMVLSARRDDGLASGTVCVPAGHPDTAALGAMFGALTVEKASGV
jgi:NADH-quinone oxidoreductase subunit G